MLELKTHAIGSKVTDFLNVVDYIYQRDPNYVRPLDMDMKDRLSFKNPFFEHGDGVMFTAHRNGFCVGRCTAQIDRGHLARYKDDTGFFGFFDTIEDQEVAKLLIDAASRWLRERGMKKMRGPLSWSINEEMGCLIEGFHKPPMVMMPHHLPYQGGLLEGCGLQKLKDLYAWEYHVGPLNERTRKAHDELAALPEVKTRHIDMKNLDADVRVVMDVFNDAWIDNWSFVPFTEKELSKLAADLKLIAIPELTYIAEIDGEAAAVAVALPNVNELIRDMKGKLGPLELGKLLWRLKVQGPKTARLAILGIRKKFRNQRKYAGLSVYLYAKLNESGQKLGIQWGELSWTLEDNGPVNVAIRLMGGKIYKKYRLYEKNT
ncbi:MAG: N-acetyltransferase [Myxococcales bacterium]